MPSEDSRLPLARHIKLDRVVFRSDERRRKHARLT